MSDKIFCERCGEKLNPKKVVWLDLNTFSLEYSSIPWSPEETQGAFPFGIACAKRADFAAKEKGPKCWCTGSEHFHGKGCPGRPISPLSLAKKPSGRGK